MSRPSASRLFAQAANGLRQSTNQIASSSKRFASTSSASEPASSSYPFNPTALLLPSTVPPTSIPQSLLTPRKGWSIINHLNATAPKSQYHNLFSRRHPDRLKTGSVITVLQYTDATKKTVSPFSGVLMGIKKRGGVDTSFKLRNIVNKIGVEMSFKLNSPLIKEIKVVREAQGRSGQIKDLRRSKVNYLRERQGLMAGIASALKASKK
ncbi:ribosomal protein L19 [Kwoniella mangroviensis CBS 10435]|uniref:Ribosomal protein L19 n=1 Tax=Kwoniella mangroviensis CBS 10435 TaxID=1331196 RepID=A0A1B9IQX0_9TREE|nr:ribosomal protein L19 [Kwoniella mangroviensis CBS 10435]OCF74943.1 ribosomal protein L19 [Kwoniella mangroviensis CBS 8886]